MRTLLAVGLLALLPAISLASMGTGNPSGFYLGAGLGNTSLNLSSTEFGDAGSKDEFGVKITGGYQFHPFFAAELSYYYPGEFKESSDEGALKVTANIFQASLVGMFPIAGNLRAFGRAGVARWDGDLDVTVDGLTGSASDSGTDFNWGLGLALQVTDHFSLRGEFEQSKIDTDIAGVLPVTWRVRFFQLSGLYRF